MRVLTAGGKSAGKLCTICQTGIVAGERIVYCPDCSLPFHKECWDEMRGCSQYGCRSAPETVKSDTAAPLTMTGWGGDKRCPACGRTIKAQALKCRFCGAAFDTREQITRAQYVRREYEGKEYVSVRNKIIAVFLVSATGCLSPVALILFAALIFAGRCIGIEYRRLPSALKAVAVVGFGIDCLLTVTMLLLVVLDRGGA
jgi:hypothetical protein